MPSNLCDATTPVKRDIQERCYPPDVAEPSKERSRRRAGASTASFDAFLKQAIREYYDRGWTTRKGNFIALLIASGQTSLALAKDSVVDGSGTKKVAIGAGLLLALRIGLRYALGGPLGLVLARRGGRVDGRVLRPQPEGHRQEGLDVYKTAIADNDKRYDEVQAGWRDGKYQITDRNLMIDGLMKQFITQIDEA